MIRNKIYRSALEQVIPEIKINDGKVLVTGASGLIGSCIIDLLMLANDYGRAFEVYALGRDEEKLKKRFDAFNLSKKLHFVEQDICQPLDNSICYDYIVHGASNADPRSYALYPAETMLITFEGAVNVLKYCKEHPKTKTLMMSTFEVYGNMSKDVYEESDSGVVDLNMIRSCYPESKRGMEILTRCYVQEYGVNAVIVRLCSIYGPTMAKDDSKAHAQFIRNGLNGENIVLKSRGEQKRTYCYVIDAVTGILCVLANGKVGEAYNISNLNSVVSVFDVAQTVADITKTKVVMQIPVIEDVRMYSPPQNVVLGNEKLKSIGWFPRYDIRLGMKQTLDILNELACIHKKI